MCIRDRFRTVDLHASIIFLSTRSSDGANKKRSIGCQIFLDTNHVANVSGVSHFFKIILKPFVISVLTAMADKQVREAREGKQRVTCLS